MFFYRSHVKTNVHFSHDHQGFPWQLWNHFLEHFCNLQNVVFNKKKQEKQWISNDFKLSKRCKSWIPKTLHLNHFFVEKLCDIQLTLDFFNILWWNHAKYTQQNLVFWTETTFIFEFNGWQNRSNRNSAFFLMQKDNT